MHTTPENIDGEQFASPEQCIFAGLRVDLPNPLDLSDAVRLHVEPQNDELPVPAGVETHIDRVPIPPSGAHPDAMAEPVASNPTVAGEAGGLLTPLVAVPRPQPALLSTHLHDLIPGGPALLRDRIALLDIVRFRILSFRDLHGRVFGGLHKAVVTRRMQALERLGYISVWEKHLVVGGHPCYALPTRKGLAWALAELGAEALGTPHEKLVAFMRGADPRPLLLEPRTSPPFLTHQMETTRVVAALESNPDLGITWASTWHRPFPNQIDRIAMPQPDAVLLATRDGKPHLVFLEHDRGQEAPASFARKKAERYYDLSLYGFTGELFGLDAFSVWVTVNDVAGGKPLQRIRVLQGVSEKARMMRFTLAGWTPDQNRDRPIWFSHSGRITAQENTPSAHEGLVGPFAEPNDAATMDSSSDLLRRIRASPRARPVQEPLEE
jgi:Replication-relaxation